MFRDVIFIRHFDTKNESALVQSWADNMYLKKKKGETIKKVIVSVRARQGGW